MKLNSKGTPFLFRQKGEKSVNGEGLETAGYRVTTAGSRLMLLLKRYGLGLILYRAPCAIKGVLRNELEEVKKEKESIHFKIEKFDNALKDLDSLLGNKRVDIDKKGLGFNEYRAVPPPPA
ncbi:hypothetical protein Tco_0091166 [Tanacetum coccineum]